MSEELKDFFETLKNSKNEFLLTKLYYYPNLVLGNEQDPEKTEEEYINLPNYYDLILNENLAGFLQLALKDEKFYNKLDFQMCRKLSFFIYDSIEFKKHYFLQDDIMEVFNKKMSISEYYKKHKSNTRHFLGFAELSERYKHLFEHQYEKEQVENYDEYEAKLIHERLQVCMMTSLEKKAQEDSKRIILKVVKEDDYLGDPDDIYLNRNRLIRNRNDEVSVINLEVCDALVCNNEFLEIVEGLLNEKIIWGVVLDNIIDIIDTSIRIKNYTMSYQDVLFFRDHLTNEVVNAFDIKRAQKLLSELTLYKMKNKKRFLRVLK